MRTLIALIASAALTGCLGGNAKLDKDETTEMLQLAGKVQGAVEQCRANQADEPQETRLTPEQLADLSASGQAEYLRGQTMKEMMDTMKEVVASVKGDQWGECDGPYKVLTAYVQTQGQISQAKASVINRALATVGIPLGIFVDKAGTAMIVDKATGDSTTVGDVQLTASQSADIGSGEGSAAANGTRNMPINIGGQQATEQGAGSLLGDEANMQSLQDQATGNQGQQITDPATLTDPSGDNPEIGGQGNEARLLP